MGKFEFYERVCVTSSDPAKAGVTGKRGAVLGKSQDADGAVWYAVFVYDAGRVWMFAEAELVATGEFDQEESFYSGRSVRVSPRGEVLGSSD